MLEAYRDRFRWLGFIILSLISMMSFAQVKVPTQQYAFPFKHIDVSNGLANNHVSAIMQDRKGFIWIASTALQRYDGTNFLTVADFNRLPGSLFYEDIYLFEDRDGKIFIGTPINIQVYDPLKGRTKVIPLKMDASNIPVALGCRTFIQDHTGTIFAVSDYGLLEYDSSSNAFFKSKILPTELQPSIQAALMEDNLGQVWMSSKDEMLILSRDRKQIFNAEHNPHHNPVLDIKTSFKQCYQDAKGFIWLAGRDNHLYKYDPVKNQLESFRFDNPDLHPLPGGYHGERTFDITSDTKSNVWIATKQAGIWRYNSQTGIFDVNIMAHNHDDLGLHYNYESNCFLSDRDGHLWVGTDAGVNIVSLHNQSLYRLDHRTRFKNTGARLPRSEVTGLFQSSTGDIFIGYWGQGFSRLDSQLQLQQNYIYDRQNKPGSIPEEHGLVWSFAELPNKTVLIGQENGWISQFDPVTRKMRHSQPPQFAEQTVLKLYPENDSCVWVGLYKIGLAKWNPQSGEVQNYPNILKNFGKSVTVMDITRENDSMLWISTNTSGVILFDINKGLVKQNITFWQPNHHFINNVSALHRFNDTSLLVGTDHGLFLYNAPKQSYKPVNIQETPFDEWVLSMEGCKEGNHVWLTTPNGFYKYGLQEDKLTTFVQNDDIIDNRRKIRRSIARMQNDNLLVGASDHIIVLNPGKLDVAPSPPDVTIVSLSSSGEQIDIDAAIASNTAVHLEPKQNFIDITFKSLQYHHEPVRYYYMLEGIDKNWVNAGGILVAKYTNLPPGSYAFKVRSVNTGGTVSAHITTLLLNVEPNYWQTWWFKLMGILLLVILVYAYFRLRLYLVKRRERERAAFQKQIDQLEMKALRSQMSPHFIFNSLNSIQKFMLQNESEQAVDYLGRFARLIRSVLDHTQSNTITIAKEASMLENYLALEQLRLANQFEYDIYIDPVIDKDFTEIPTMILQPFVENAVWHGLYHKPGGQLKVHFLREGNAIHCIVEDNGIGRMAARSMKRNNGHSHLSKGLQITRDRLSIYNSRYNLNASFDIEDLVDADGNATGTRVNIWFPLITD